MQRTKNQQEQSSDRVFRDFVTSHTLPFMGLPSTPAAGHSSLAETAAEMSACVRLRPPLVRSNILREYSESMECQKGLERGCRALWTLVAVANSASTVRLQAKTRGCPLQNIKLLLPVQATFAGNSVDELRAKRARKPEASLLRPVGDLAISAIMASLLREVTDLRENSYHSLHQRVKSDGRSCFQSAKASSRVYFQ